MADQTSSKGGAVAFFDIDGTLTGRVVETGNMNEMPSEYTEAMLREFVDAGNLAFLSSGRGPLGLARFLEVLPFAGFISLDGSFVKLGDEVLVDEEFPEEVIWELVREICDLGFYCSFEGRDGHLGLNYPDRVFGGEAISTIEQVREKFPELHMGKMNITEEGFRALEKVCAVLDEVEIFDAGADSYELAPKGVGKDKGAKAILEALPNDPSCVMAFGDSENDLPVLRVADIAVAMGDSPKSLLEIANLVTGTAQESGVGHALKQLEAHWK